MLPLQFLHHDIHLPDLLVQVQYAEIQVVDLLPQRVHVDLLLGHVHIGLSPDVGPVGRYHASVPEHLRVREFDNGRILVLAESRHVYPVGTQVKRELQHVSLPGCGSLQGYLGKIIHVGVLQGKLLRQVQQTVPPDQRIILLHQSVDSVDRVSVHRSSP